MFYKLIDCLYKSRTKYDNDNKSELIKILHSLHKSNQNYYYFSMNYHKAFSEYHKTNPSLALEISSLYNHILKTKLKGEYAKIQIIKKNEELAHSTKELLDLVDLTFFSNDNAPMSIIENSLKLESLKTKIIRNINNDINIWIIRG